jgi:hypothetical protein
MSDAATYTREDMARAFDAGVLAMSRALQGGSEPVNPYRVPETASDEQVRACVHCGRLVKPGPAEGQWVDDSGTSTCYTSPTGRHVHTDTWPWTRRGG